MRYLSVLTLACASCSPVPVVAVDLVGDTIVATAQERHKLTQCHRHDGCYIVTGTEIAVMAENLKNQIVAAASVVAAQMIQEANESCRKGKL